MPFSVLRREPVVVLNHSSIWGQPSLEHDTVLKLAALAIHRSLIFGMES